ncbi:MAG: nuclear transport factor 2 family protein [Gammaproteobacteria bacterium]
MRHIIACSAIRRHGGLLAAALFSLQAGQASGQPLTTAAVEKWLAGYERAWESRDAARAAELFAANASYHEMPFEAPKAGQAGIREYWSSVTADQRDIDFKAQIIAVSGQTGVAHWSATFTAVSTGARVELDGMFVLTFDAIGRCSELREWWHVKP